MMVPMKSFLTLLISISIWSTAQAQVGVQNSITIGIRAESALGIIVSWLQQRQYHLKQEDLDRHSQSVYFALSNLDNGQEVKWFNNQNNTAGAVQVAYSYPTGGGHCRRIYSIVNTSGKERTFEDTACYNIATNSWKFLNK